MSCGTKKNVIGRPASSGCSLDEDHVAGSTKNGCEEETQRINLKYDDELTLSAFVYANVAVNGAGASALPGPSTNQNGPSGNHHAAAFTSSPATLTSGHRGQGGPRCQWTSGEGKTTLEGQDHDDHNIDDPRNFPGRSQRE